MSVDPIGNRSIIDGGGSSGSTSSSQPEDLNSSVDGRAKGSFQKAVSSYRRPDLTPVDIGQLSRAQIKVLRDSIISADIGQLSRAQFVVAFDPDNVSDN